MISLGVVEVGEHKVDYQVRESCECKQDEKKFGGAIECQSQGNLDNAQDGQTSSEPLVDLHLDS